MKKRYGSPKLQVVTDLNVMLECLYEAYDMEGCQLLSGKNIHTTMIYPFLRMILTVCKDIQEEELHKNMWKIYEQKLPKQEFIIRALKQLRPYQRGDHPNERYEQNKFNGYAM